MLVHDNNQIEWRESTKGKEERKETTRGARGLWEGKAERATKFTWRSTATPSRQGPSPASGHAPHHWALWQARESPPFLVLTSQVCTWNPLSQQPTSPHSAPAQPASFHCHLQGHIPWASSEPPGLASFPYLHFHLAFSFPALPPLTVLNQGITYPTSPLNISWIYALWGLYLSNLLFHYCQILKQMLAHYNTYLFVKWIILYEAF